VPGRLGFALTGIRPRLPHIAGMDERWDGIGQAVIDLVVSLLKNNDAGVPRFPRFVLVEGRWTEGATVRPAGPR
jgi:LacI family transcriptional regulator